MAVGVSAEVAVFFHDGFVSRYHWTAGLGGGVNPWARDSVAAIERVAAQIDCGIDVAARVAAFVDRSSGEGRYAVVVSRRCGAFSFFYEQRRFGNAADDGRGDRKCAATIAKARRSGKGLSVCTEPHGCFDSTKWKRS